MEAEVVHTQEEGIGVQVIDNDGCEHILALTWDGTTDVHQQDRFPHSREERTDEQERLMLQVRERAKFAAHHQTEAEILPPGWVPANLIAAMEAIREADSDYVREHFRDLYDAVRDPESFVDDPECAAIHRIRQSLYMDEEGEIVKIDPLDIQYETTEGETRYTIPNPDEPGELNRASITLPPLSFERDDFTFPDSFQALLVSHFMCQVRDVYLNMGEEPPSEYRVKGEGKTMTLHDGLIEPDI